MEQVIIVNEDDHEIGALEKIEAHLSGKMHRAFSIFIFNSDGKLLIHKRADDKYHSGGLWTNTCCGHQRPDESLEMSTQRRLKEEMGFDCELKKLFTIRYQAEMNNRIIENEIDHVFSGIYNQDPRPDPLEVSDYSWADPKELIIDMRDNPDKYSYWFKLLLERVIIYTTNYLSTSR